MRGTLGGFRGIVGLWNGTLKTFVAIGFAELKNHCLGHKAHPAQPLSGNELPGPK